MSTQAIINNSVQQSIDQLVENKVGLFKIAQAGFANPAKKLISKSGRKIGMGQKAAFKTGQGAKKVAEIASSKKAQLGAAAVGGWYVGSKYETRKRPTSNMAPPGLKRRSMVARGVTGATGAMKGGLGGGLKGGAKGAAIGGVLGSVVPGAGTLVGAGVGGAVGAGVGALRGAGRGAARGFRKFKKAPSIADQTYNERKDSMKTVTIVNNSEQRRVQTQMTLNRLNASLEPVEMITENSIGSGLRKAGARFMAGAKGIKKGVGAAAKQGTPYKAGRKVRGAGLKAHRAGQEAGRHVKKNKTAYQTAGAVAGGGYVGYKLKKARGR